MGWPLQCGTIAWQKRCKYLKRLTKWVLEEPETDQDAAQCKECFVDVWSSFKADPQTAELMKPTVRAFDNPAKHAQAAAVFGIAFRKHRSNTASPQSLAMGFGIVRSITLNTFGASPLSTFAANVRDRIHQRDQLRYVVSVRPCQRGRQWDAIGIREYVMLRAGFAAIRGIRASLRPPKTARTDVLSTTTRDQSICSASSSLCSNTRRIFSHTPASCQSRSRRQHVMPDPHPISLGKYSQGMPVLRTNNIPVSTERLSFGFRPGFRRRRFFGGGNSGSSSFHNSSSKIGRAMIVTPCTARQYSQDKQVLKRPFC
jgi:hypothetical protein